jgi:hypothetical protein
MMAYRVRKICKALVVPGVPKPGFGSCIAQGGLFIVLKGGYLSVTFCQEYVPLWREVWRKSPLVLLRDGVRCLF